MERQPPRLLRLIVSMERQPPRLLLLIGHAGGRRGDGGRWGVGWDGGGACLGIPSQASEMDFDNYLRAQSY